MSVTDISTATGTGPGLNGMYGLHVVGAVGSRPAHGTFSCVCGHIQRATGTEAVTALVASAEAKHASACPFRSEKAAVA